MQLRTKGEFSAESAEHTLDDRLTELNKLMQDIHTHIHTYIHKYTHIHTHMLQSADCLHTPQSVLFSAKH